MSSTPLGTRAAEEGEDGHLISMFKEFLCLFFFSCDSCPFRKVTTILAKSESSFFEKLQVMVNCAQGRSRSAKFTIATWMQHEATNLCVTLTW